jgi:hypothetical protein
MYGLQWHEIRGREPRRGLEVKMSYFGDLIVEFALLLTMNAV